MSLLRADMCISELPCLSCAFTWQLYMATHALTSTCTQSGYLQACAMSFSLAAIAKCYNIILRRVTYLPVKDWFADEAKEDGVCICWRCFDSRLLCLCSSQEQADELCMAAGGSPVQCQPPMVIPAPIRCLRCPSHSPLVGAMHCSPHATHWHGRRHSKQQQGMTTADCMKWCKGLLVKD